MELMSQVAALLKAPMPSGKHHKNYQPAIGERHVNSAGNSHNGNKSKHKKLVHRFRTKSSLTPRAFSIDQSTMTR